MSVVFFKPGMPVDGPAETFPGEPGDMPALQAGDPGAEPPPANLVQADAPDHIIDYVAASFTAGRFKCAFAAMVQGLTAATRYAEAALLELNSGDVVHPAMKPILMAYVDSTSAFAKALRAHVDTHVAERKATN